MEEFRQESYTAIYRLVDGMLSCVVKKDQIIDRRLAEKITRERKEYCQGKAYPTLIVFPSENLLLEYDAIQFLATTAGMAECSELAVVVRASLRNILINVNMLFVPHKIPFRVFTSRSEAKLWLFGYIKENEGLELEF